MDNKEELRLKLMQFLKEQPQSILSLSKKIPLSRKSINNFLAGRTTSFLSHLRIEKYMRELKDQSNEIEGHLIIKCTQCDTKEAILRKNAENHLETGYWLCSMHMYKARKLDVSG